MTVHSLARVGIDKGCFYSLARVGIDKGCLYSLARVGIDIGCLYTALQEWASIWVVSTQPCKSGHRYGLLEFKLK